MHSFAEEMVHKRMLISISVHGPPVPHTSRSAHEEDDLHAAVSLRPSIHHHAPNAFQVTCPRPAEIMISIIGTRAREDNDDPSVLGLCSATVGGLQDDRCEGRGET